MADAEDVRPLVVDNGFGMVKVRISVHQSIAMGFPQVHGGICAKFDRLVLLEMMLQGLSSPVWLVDRGTPLTWLVWATGLLMLELRPNLKGADLL